jgi:methionyl-tRNA synthetase
VPCDSNELLEKSKSVIPQYLAHMDELSFQRAIETGFDLLVAINAYIVSREPWKHFKEKGADESLSRVIWNTLEAQRLVWVMLAPFMPRSSREALGRLGVSPDAISSDDLQWGRLPNSQALQPATGMFPRVDITAYVGKNMDETKQQPSPSDDASAAPSLETTQAVTPEHAPINIDHFMSVDLRVAEIRSAERVPKSKKLIKLTVFTGDGERTVVAGIGTKYEPDELTGRKVVIVANLQPAKLMGIESNGMVLAASIEGEPVLLSVDPATPAGTRVR